MIARVYSSSIFGFQAQLVEIEVDMQPGLPGMQIVGLPDAVVSEAKDRVRSAIVNSGYDYPRKKIIVNLAPASLKKSGNYFDLPIAIGILIASEQIPCSDENNSFIIVGELSLNGEIRSVRGALLISQLAHSSSIQRIILPEQNVQESALIQDVNTYPAKTLVEAVNIYSSPSESSFQIDIAELYQDEESYSIDFKEIKGQYQIKRGVEVACAGNHNLLLTGPPGCGKTMIAKRIPTIYPKMTLSEALELTKIYSIAGLLPPDVPLIQTRPFRNPHHTASDIAIVGGGSHPKPGEITLAHHGVLFLDELPEFKKNVLQALREPLEEKKITISRIEYSVTFPSDFMLVTAMNPCPCGYLSHPEIDCICTEKQKKNYLGKISGPLLDRMDIQLEVSKISFEELSGNYEEESSEIKRERINCARHRQKIRYQQEKVNCNSQISRNLIDKHCKLSDSSKDILQLAMNNYHFSARGYDKILKVSRTIADLADREEIQDSDIMEAIQYRAVDRLFKL